MKNYPNEDYSEKNEKEAKKLQKNRSKYENFNEENNFFLKIIVLRINLQKRKIITTNQISEIEMRTN